MKQAPSPDLHAAFPDEKHRPADADLPAALGPAFAPLDQVLGRLRKADPRIAPEWKYSPRAGWYLIFNRKKRRILYLLPARRGFQLRLVLGDQAIDALRRGPCANRMPGLLKTAKRYPEGTFFSFAHDTIDVALVGALLEAKLAH